MPEAGERVLGRGQGARASSVAVIPPFSNAACREGRLLVAEAGSPITALWDLPCVERGDCASPQPRPVTPEGPAGEHMTSDAQLLMLQDRSILHLRSSEGAIQLARSADCGETWTTSRLEAHPPPSPAPGARDGAWGRFWAYADPLDPHNVIEFLHRGLIFSLGADRIAGR